MLVGDAQKRDEQSGNDVASWIPMLKERTRSWHSRNRSSLTGVSKNSFRRVWRDGGGGCNDSVHEGVGRDGTTAIEALWFCRLGELDLLQLGI